MKNCNVLLVVLIFLSGCATQKVFDPVVHPDGSASQTVHSQTWHVIAPSVVTAKSVYCPKGENCEIIGNATNIVAGKSVLGHVASPLSSAYAAYQIGKGIGNSGDEVTTNESHETNVNQDQTQKGGGARLNNDTNVDVAAEGGAGGHGGRGGAGGSGGSSSSSSSPTVAPTIIASNRSGPVSASTGPVSARTGPVTSTSDSESNPTVISSLTANPTSISGASASSSASNYNVDYTNVDVDVTQNPAPMPMPMPGPMD